MNDSKADIFYHAASVWNELTEYNYLFTYGYKHKLYEINLIFSPEDFPHLAGFQYLKDISLPRFSPEKTVSRILDGTIKIKQIQKAAGYKDLIVPRLETLVQIKDALDNDFILFSYMPDMYPFYTQIKADYLISYHSDVTNFIFLVRSNSSGTAKFDYLCCSAFKRGDRDYETNQRSRALLKKERIHVSTNTSTILLDKLSTQNNSKGKLDFDS